MLMLDKVREHADDFDALHFDIDYIFRCFGPRPADSDQRFKQAGSSRSPPVLSPVSGDAALTGLECLNERRLQGEFRRNGAITGPLLDLHRRLSRRAAAIWHSSVISPRRKGLTARLRSPAPSPLAMRITIEDESLSISQRRRARYAWTLDWPERSRW